MKRALILVLLVVALCVAALWLRPQRVSAPIDVVIDHEPYCAQSIYRNGTQVHMNSVTRGVCTSKNVRSTQ